MHYTVVYKYRIKGVSFVAGGGYTHQARVMYLRIQDKYITGSSYMYTCTI